MQRESGNEFVGREFPRPREPAIDARGIATERLDARQMHEGFDMPRVELDDPDKRLTRLARRTAAQRIQVKQRFAEAEPGVGVVRIVQR